MSKAECGIYQITYFFSFEIQGRDLITSVAGEVWASGFQSEQTTATAVWPLYIASLMLVGLYAVTMYGFQRAPDTIARKLDNKLRKQPQNIYPLAYELFTKDEHAVEVLNHLVPYLEERDDQVTSARAQFLALMPQVDEDEVDINAIGLSLMGTWSAEGRSSDWNNALYKYYRIRARIYASIRISDIVKLELAVNPGPQPGEFYLSLYDGQTPILPPFLPKGIEAGWRALEQVTVALRKYEAVDAATDRLSYLAQALTAVEAAQTAVSQIGLPEGPLMQRIADNWRTAVTNEINTISGRAELRLELRTRQLRRAEAVTVAFRLQNVGRAAAEDVSLALSIEDTVDTQTLARLPSGQGEMIEFDLTPPETDSLRLTCQVQWQDLTAVVQSLDFADVVHFYETAAEFTPIPNPYIVGHPVKGTEMFHGREDAFRFIAQNLEGEADRTLVLHGQRRTGKTSILYQLLNGRLGPHFLPVLIDMQELAPIIDSTADFLGEMAYQLARTVQKADIDIQEPDIELFEKAAVRTFNRFLDRLEDNLGERRLVIMFDEFELIESKIAEGKLEADLLGYFRSLMQHRQKLVFIFTGTHRLEEMSHDYWSILFNIALYRRVSFLTQADAVRLIRKPVKGNLDVDELAVEKIVTLTRGHAYFTQLICWALVNHCNVQQQNYATINDVNDAVAEVVRTGEAHFAFVWQQAGNSERLVLAALAHTLRPGKMWARPAEGNGNIATSWCYAV